MSLLKSASYRTQFSLFIIGFILTLSISSFLYLRWLQDNFIETALNAQGEVISELIAADMAQLVFLADPDVLAAVTFKLKGIKELRSATFYDKNKNILLKIKNQLAIDDMTNDILEVDTGIRYDDVLVGFATLNLHSDALHREKIRTNKLYLLFLSILILMGLLLAYLLDHRFMIRLTQLSSALKYAAENQDFSKQLIVDKEDDIGEAKRYFNQLIGLVEKQTSNLLYQANHDGLTGLYNRNKLIVRLDDMLKKRPKIGFHAVCYLDLDQFKVVNDTCGHAVGDDLLKKLSAQLLQQIMTFDDVVFGRIGGDEFIVLLKDKAKGEIHAVIHKLQEVAQKFKFTFL